MAKKEEYHNLKDLQSDELNLEKVIEKIREEAKEEEHNIAKEYNMTIDEVEKQIDLEMIKYDLKMRKAMDIIKG